METRRLVIVGSGPAGYTAGVYAARADLQPLIIAGAVSAGGALMTTTRVDNFPGFPLGIEGPDLMLAIQAQAERFGAEILADDVILADLLGTEKIVTTESGRTFVADAVIIATGSAYRHLGVAGEERLSGYGVSWCATCDGALFRGKEVVVVGGGDSALEECTYVARFASRVTLVHRGGTFRASKAMQHRLAALDNVEVRFRSEVVGIHGNANLDSVTIRDGRMDQESEIKTEGLFIAIGQEPRSGLFAGQLAMDPQGYITVDASATTTSADGVFACGDVVDRRYRQAITAAGSGCAAALDAEAYLAARTRSTDRGAETISRTHGATVGPDGIGTEPGSSAAEDPEMTIVTPQILDDANFDEVINSSTKPVLVDFWAGWCSPCQLLHPVIDRIAAMHADRIMVAKVDVDASPTVAAKYRIKALPALRVFVGGEIQYSSAGAKSYRRLVTELADYLRPST